VDAIEEFSVITSHYSAEDGKTSGGVVYAVRRSGTNAFHGDAYEFLRSSALDARSFFDGPVLPAFRRDCTGAPTGVAGLLTSTTTAAREIAFALKVIWQPAVDLIVRLN
jgi:hypothetical protein